jgi:uncharacterized membrane protein YsdA (DUF1294 family)
MKLSLPLLAAVYLLVLNLAAFLAFAVDKRAAKRHEWRIPEARLLGLCALGGWLGGLLGMKVFRHKTRKPKFFVGIPLIAAVWVAAAVFLLFHVKHYYSGK